MIVWKGRKGWKSVLALLVFAALSACPAAVTTNNNTGSNGGTLSDVWTWISGSDSYDIEDIYGVMGTASSSNCPGGRNGSVRWTDATGNLWLFGGRQTTPVNYKNDLWMYNISTSQWTWMGGTNISNVAGIYGVKGVAADTNLPGSRYAAAYCKDASGNVWIFGGFGFDYVKSGGNLCDLWKFDGSNWTWIAGKNARQQSGIYGTKGVANISNCPGGRYSGKMWADSSGCLWLFGGTGLDSTGGSGTLNDLWKFDGTNWIWISGTNVASPTGIYGIKGTADISNTPGGRNKHAVWTDSTGNLWLYGGIGYSTNTSLVSLSDMWMFDITTGLWTWISGSMEGNLPAVHGVRGIASSSNTPGGRTGDLVCMDHDGNVWLYGGSKIGGIYGDLWKYETASSNWIWVSGSDVTNQMPTNGSIGVPAKENYPGCRFDAMLWPGVSSGIYLFGGSCVDFQYKNDLWIYKP